MQTMRKSVEIASALEQEIHLGRFVPGEVIDENDIANRFSVSRTPVREALLNLSAAGLVELQRGRGAVVIGTSLDAVFEAYEILANSLGFACELAAMRMTPFQRAELRAVAARMRTAAAKKERDDFIALDGELHDAILQGAKNSLLTRLVNDCKRRIAAVRALSIRSHKTLDHILPELEKIVEAIADGDAAGARAAFQEHMTLRGEGAQKLIAHWQTLQKRSA